MGKVINWTVDGVKTFKGMEGSGFNARLKRDGKHIADVIDEGSGGPLLIRWMDAGNDSYVDATVIDWSGAEKIRRATPEEARLLAHVLALKQTDEAFIYKLVDDWNLAKQFRRLIAPGRVAILTTDRKVFTLKATVSAAVRATIAQKYPGAVVLNDLSVSEGVEVLRHSA